MSTFEITLAGKPYTIQPLTLGQIEDLSVSVVLADSDDPQENIRRSYQRTIGTLVAALSADYPQLDAKALRNLRITKAELTAARDVILENSGLQPKAPSTGEEKPPVETETPGASTGPTSTDASAQG